MKIAIQGAKSSFHDIAARKYFGPNIDTVYCETFADCFDSLKKNKTEYALVAIENSLYGSINQVYDLLLKTHARIIGEVYLQIEQCLVGLPGAKLEDIKEVYSHPVALAQCEDFLNNKLSDAERFEHPDTALSAQEVAGWNNPEKAAIASREAAKLHRLKVIASGIETNKQNYTRFVVLSNGKKIPDGANKSSIILTTSHKSGALYKALGVFAKYKVNLTKLQSRPIIGQAWHYMFYIDLDFSIASTEFSYIQTELEAQGCELIPLGGYKSAI